MGRNVEFEYRAYGPQVVQIDLPYGRYTYYWTGEGELAIGDEVLAPISWLGKARGETEYPRGTVAAIGSDYDGIIEDLIGRAPLNDR